MAMTLNLVGSGRLSMHGLTPCGLAGHEGKLEIIDADQLLKSLGWTQNSNRPASQTRVANGRYGYPAGIATVALAGVGRMMMNA
ncbi:hypothetical protein [Rhodoferax sp.]|uniref:hypothetical protein n=1 Tax=Rhodoferax sp. TaxID=50421 RepID=UPI0025F12D8D|nr:hypothetical protein [Rhodoferax sp.]